MFWNEKNFVQQTQDNTFVATHYKDVTCDQASVSGLVVASGCNVTGLSTLTDLNGAVSCSNGLILTKIVSQWQWYEQKIPYKSNGQTYYSYYYKKGWLPSCIKSVTRDFIKFIKLSFNNSLSLSLSSIIVFILQ